MATQAMNKNSQQEERHVLGGGKFTETFKDSMDFRELLLKDKHCTIHGLTQRTDLNGHFAKVVEWKEDISRMCIKLNTGKEMALKLSNITMGELEPLVCSFKIRDKLENRHEETVQLAIRKNMLLTDELMNKVFSTVAHMEFAVIAKGRFTCTPFENCNETAVLCVSTPGFCRATNDRPATVTDWLCMPICTRKECDNEAKRQTEKIIRFVSKEQRKAGCPGFRDGQRRYCANCKSVSTRKDEYKKCSRCLVTFYCSKDCQVSHWRVHKETCS